MEEFINFITEWIIFFIFIIGSLIGVIWNTVKKKFFK